MTILGLGVDIVEVARIEELMSRRSNRLALRILRASELAVWEKHHRKAHFLAKRLAVKEAAAKAFGIGISSGLRFNHLEIFNDELGKPYLHLWDKALYLANNMGVKHIHVTLADERNYACAAVIIEN